LLEALEVLIVLRKLTKPNMLRFLEKLILKWFIFA